MSTERQSVTVRDLVEEAKKRIVFLVICMVGLSYIMSLTSSSVWVNLPAAALLIVILRYFSLDFDMRRKAAAYNSKPAREIITSQRKHFESSKVLSEWRNKVNSPAVEDAIDEFTRHLISEWVTDLWYSRITPDRQAPEELVQIMNDVLGEMSCRMKNINLIDFLTRDIVSLICAHLELFRASQTKISKQHLSLAAIEHRDLELKSVLAADNKLHPALFGAEAEHKVLQHIMEGLISFTFKPEDMQCSLFRYIVRELLACAVMKPVLNLASPRFINERIESLVISLNKAEKGSTVEQVALHNKPNGPLKVSSDHFSQFLDPSAKGVELVQLKKDQPTAAEKPATDGMNGVHSKDPLLSMDTRSTRSWGSLPLISQTGDGKAIQRYGSGGEWGNVLDLMSRRKTEALAPEHFENMWTKGRNYKWKEGLNQSKEPVSHGSQSGISNTVDSSSSRQLQKDAGYSERPTVSNSFTCTDAKKSSNPSVISYDEDDELSFTSSDEVDSGFTSSYHTEDEETGNVTGLDSPSVKVWDGKSSRHFSVSHIHHPLENFEGHKTRKMDKVRVHSQRHLKTKSGWKRSRLSSQKLPVWQEVERTSFLSGGEQDILNPLKDHLKSEGSSDDYEAENMSRIQSGSAASSSLSSVFLPDSHSLANASKNSLLLDSFLKLRCEVTGANIVKSGSKTFAVYSISVIDINNNCWSVKRRFRHFEELHRRLKEYPEYNLHLPPKHFFSTGLDVPVIQERCKLLDVYLKLLLGLPTISGSIEVWDFLSIDSQSYIFPNSISIVDTLSVNADITTHEKSKDGCDTARPKGREDFNAEGTGSAPLVKNSITVHGSRLNSKNVALSPPKKSSKERGKSFEDTGSESDNVVQKITHARNLEKVHEGDGSRAPSELLVNDATDPTIPAEWVPPNLSAPVLDLVDVIFQLQDGGWIRRKAFWVVKQVLQLGMGDALDDWLIDKIQLLRKGSVVASGIRRVEQILWPDGIFITKHPKQQRPAPSGTSNINSLQGQSSTALSSPNLEDIQKVDELQQKEMEQRAKLVYELMIDNAPAAVVGLVGRKEYEQCAKDVYYFLQSSVCLKQLAYGLLELLLLSAFPELDYVFEQLHAEKEKFGHYRPK